MNFIDLKRIVFVYLYFAFKFIFLFSGYLCNGLNLTAHECKDEDKIYCCFGYHKKDGKCVECNPGIKREFGICDPCPSSKYGENCMLKCTCNSYQRCDPEFGCLPRVSTALQTTQQEVKLDQTSSDTTVSETTQVMDKTTEDFEDKSENSEGSDSKVWFYILVGCFIMISTVLLLIFKTKIYKKMHSDTFQIPTIQQQTGGPVLVPNRTFVPNRPRLQQQQNRTLHPIQTRQQQHGHTENGNGGVYNQDTLIEIRQRPLPIPRVSHHLYATVDECMYSSQTNRLTQNSCVLQNAIRESIEGCEQEEATYMYPYDGLNDERRRGLGVVSPNYNHCQDVWEETYHSHSKLNIRNPIYGEPKANITARKKSNTF